MELFFTHFNGYLIQSSYLNPVVQRFGAGQKFIQSFGVQHLFECLVGALELDPDSDVIVRAGVKPGATKMSLLLLREAF